MSAARRVERLRRLNPAAAELAVVCALAARVEPELLRRLRLLVPGADASAEADLWFSELLSGRDATAIALDPLVADGFRDELRRPERAALREAAVAEIAAAHAGAHWSVRLEERIHHLDASTDSARDGDTAEEIDALLMAALDRMTTEPDPRGTARWLLGAAGRLPRQVSERPASRASTAAAGLHLDRQAPPAGLLSAAESEAWLPWLATALPTVAVPVRLLDGAVLIGSDGPDAVLLPAVPDTDPLVVEVRWNDGARAASRRVRFRLGDAVHVETGTRTVSLVTLTGTTYELTVDGPADAGLNFDHLKAGLRPCLGREEEQALLLDALRSTHAADHWVGIAGRADSGATTLLVAVTDTLRAEGTAVVEHFFTGDPRTDDPTVILRSCIAQLAECYPGSVGRHHLDARWPDTPGLMPLLDELAALRLFQRKPLVIALARVRPDPDSGAPLWLRPFPLTPPPGVHYLLSSLGRTKWIPDILDGEVRLVTLDERSDRAVCRSMIAHERAALDRVFAGPVDVDALVELASGLPVRLAPIVRWAASRPPGSVTVDTVPAALTSRWRDARAVLASRFGPQVGVALDILRAADGRNTPEDCERVAYDFGVLSPGTWPDFWDALRDHLADTHPDEPLRLADPALAAPFRHPDRVGHRYLSLRSSLLEIAVFRVGHTRLAAAVFHALASGDLDSARSLCWHVDVLRRRYVEDSYGLLADLDAVSAAVTAGADARAGVDDTGLVALRDEAAESDSDPTTGSTEADADLLALRDAVRAAATGPAVGRDADLVTLQDAVRSVLADAVPAAGFVPALCDRLTERGVEFAGPDQADLLAPLRVRRVLNDGDLRAVNGAPVDHDLERDGPVLALFTFGGSDVPVAVTSAGLRHSFSVGDLIGAVRGEEYGGLAWTADTLYAGEVWPWTQDLQVGPLGDEGQNEPALWSVGPLDGPVDWAAGLAEAVAVAGSDGTVTVTPWPSGAAEPDRRRMPGRGARVTALSGRPIRQQRHPQSTWPMEEIGSKWQVLAGSQDGLIRFLADPDRPPVVFAGHRGAVRSLVTALYAFFSGGDDGCVLHWRYDDPTRPRARWSDHQAPVTCLALTLDGTRVVAGTADGRVAAWNPDTGEQLILGSHVAPVRGVATGIDWVATWADTVRFWSLPPEPARRPLLGELTGFPGGVRDVVMGVDSVHVVCGDGTVRHRARPDLSGRDPDDHREYGCLAVRDGVTYLGLDNSLRRYGGDGPDVSPSAPGPYTQVMAVTGGLMVVDQVGGLVGVGLGQGPAPPDVSPERFVDLVSGDGHDLLVYTRDTQIFGTTVGGADIESQVEAVFGFVNRQFELAAPATSLAARLVEEPRGSGYQLVAGLTNGDTQVVAFPRRDDHRTRTLPGDGSPITAVGVLPGGHVLTGSAAGELRCWPADASQGPITYPRRAGAVTGIVTVGDWAVSSGRDGRLVLWSTHPVGPVHEVNLGAPIVALAAEPGLVAARDDRGRLWLLDLDEGILATPFNGGMQADATRTGGTVTMEIRPADTRTPQAWAECVAVRVRPVRSAVRLPVTNLDPWPPLAADGRLGSPARPTAGQPLRLEVQLPADWDDSGVLEFDLELVSRHVTGYRSWHTYLAAVSDPSRATPT